MGFQPRGMISAPPRPPVCLDPSEPESAAPRPYDTEGGGVKEEGIDGLILKGGAEAERGEGSYRLKRRFEGGSHGEVRWRLRQLIPHEFCTQLVYDLLFACASASTQPALCVLS